MALSVEELSRIGQAQAARRRRWFLAFAIPVAALCCALIILSGLSELKYRTFVFWGPPDRVTYCGRVYARNPDVVHGTPRELNLRSIGTRWQRIGRTFALHPIYATVLLDPSPGRLCAGNVYVPASGRDDYVQYSLQGGP